LKFTQFEVGVLAVATPARARQYLELAKQKLEQLRDIFGSALSDAGIEKNMML
jgi:hypothetical protein